MGQRYTLSLRMNVSYSLLFLTLSFFLFLFLYAGKEFIVTQKDFLRTSIILDGFFVSEPFSKTCFHLLKV